MKSAKLFMNGHSQAIRLPKDFRFDGPEVFLKKVGDYVVIFPHVRAWDSFFASLDDFSPDFMEEREQPEQEERELLFE